MSTKTDRALRDVFSARLERLINDSDKSQIRMAEELGYDNQNMITMFKQGKTRVPLEKVVPLARALGVNPTALIQAWFTAYMPAALASIEPYITWR
jgi:transcriptional regulator with XRE-family HTH domain